MNCIICELKNVEIKKLKLMIRITKLKQQKDSIGFTWDEHDKIIKALKGARKELRMCHLR